MTQLETSIYAIVVPKNVIYDLEYFFLMKLKRK